MISFLGTMIDTWKRSLDNELGRVADGLPKKLLGTKTIYFIKKSNISIGICNFFANRNVAFLDS